MKRYAVLVGLLLASVSFGTEKHMWLMTQTNIVGVSETATPETLYGVLVLLDSDDTGVTGFRVTLTVETSLGQVVTFAGIVGKSGKGEGVVYSDAWASYFDRGMGFKVVELKIEEIK